MVVTLKDGTVINMALVTFVEPLAGEGIYQSYDVHFSNSNSSIGIFESDIPRATFLSNM